MQGSNLYAPYQVRATDALGVALVGEYGAAFLITAMDKANETRLELDDHAANPTPYTLHPTPYTLHPTPYTLHPAPYTLHPTPYTLHPTPYTLNFKP